MQKMKVLQLDSERSWRGGQNQIYLLVKGLFERDQSVFVAAPADAKLLKVVENFATVLPLSKSYFSVRNIFRLNSFIKTHNIIIVDAHSSRAHSLGLVLKLLRPSLKLVVHRRVDFPPLRHFWSSWKYKTHLVDCYAAISFAIADLLRGSGINESKIEVARSAFDPDKTCQENREDLRRKLAKQFNLNLNCTWIGNTGALTAQKDYETFLKSLALLRKTGFVFQALIVGEGVLKSEIEQKAKDLSLNDLLVFTGFQLEISQFYLAFDIFFMPSAFEGLGTSLLEAIRGGCAVVASRVGGIPEMIPSDIQKSILAKSGDSQAFCHLLLAFLKDEAMRETINARLKEHINKFFSKDQMVSANLSIYENVLL